MPEAKRDEVPLPDITKLVERLLRYTDIRVADPRESRSALGDLFRGEISDQLREYGRQCVQAVAPVPPQEVRCAVDWLNAYCNGAPDPFLSMATAEIRTLLDWLRSQNLIKE